MSLSASSQVVAYAVVIIYSFWLGSIDFVVPVKYGLLATIGAILWEPLDVLGLQLFGKPRATFSQLGVSGFRFLVEVFAAVGIFLFSVPFVLASYSSVNLTSVSIDVKLIASLGVGLPAFFATLEIIRISRLKERLRRLSGKGVES